MHYESELLASCSESSSEQIFWKTLSAPVAVMNGIMRMVVVDNAHLQLDASFGEAGVKQGKLLVQSPRFHVAEMVIAVFLLRLIQEERGYRTAVLRRNEQCFVAMEERDVTVIPHVVVIAECCWRRHT